MAAEKDKTSPEPPILMTSSLSKMLSHGSPNSSYMSTGSDNTWPSDDSEDEDAIATEVSTEEIKAIAKNVLRNFRKFVIFWRKHIQMKD